MSEEEESFVILATSMDSLPEDCVDGSQDNDNFRDNFFTKIIKSSLKENSAVKEDNTKDENVNNLVIQELQKSNCHKIVNEPEIKQGAFPKDDIEKSTHTDVGVDSSPLTQHYKSVKLWQKPLSSSSADAEMSSSYEELNNAKTNDEKSDKDSSNTFGILSHSENSMTKTQIDSWIDLNSLQLQQQKQSQQQQSIQKNAVNERSNSVTISTTDNQTVSEPSPVIMSNVDFPLQNGNNNLAASFIMGEIDADVLKSSICTQFPSISMHASAEEVATLQSFFNDHIQLQNKFTKFTNTVRLYHKNTLQWKDNLKNTELQYKEKLQECEDQMKKLHIENESLKRNIEAQKEQMKAVEVAQQKDRLEMIQVISEKSAIVENMRAQIEKLEQAHLVSYSLTPKQAHVNRSELFEKYMTRDEHISVIKKLQENISELQGKVSELLAQNLDFKDLEKHYIDELTCLKVSLSTAEELLRESRSDIGQLKALDLTKQQQLEEIQEKNCQLMQQIKQNREHITLLEKRNQMHQRDFELEKKSCEFVTEEKGKLLKDLRKLQKCNQQLIDERQKWLDQQLALHKQMTQLPQQQQAQSSNIQIAESSQLNYCCPICNQNFTTLHDLQVHVNPCIDKLM